MNYSDSKAVSVTEINFPAVSICLPLRVGDAGLDGFNYTTIYDGITSGTRNFTELELKYLQIISLLTGAHEDFLFSLNQSIPTDDFLDRLKDFPPAWKIFDSSYDDGKKKISDQEFDWLNKYQVSVTKTLWKTGFCYIFNFPEAENIFNIEKISSDLNFSETFLFSESIELAYQNHHQPPLRTHHSILGLYGLLQLKPFDASQEIIDWHESEVLDGYRLIFHDPFELPSSNSPQFQTLTHHYVDYLIIPKMTSVDDSILNYTPDERNCYLPLEKPLNLFKIYTKNNCEHECISNLTLQTCSCVQFYHIRSNSTRICGISDAKCFRNVEKNFKQHCKCLESCENIKYDIQLVVKDAIV